MNFRWRLDGLQEQMARRGLALVVYGPGCDFRYLTGIMLDQPAPGDACEVPGVVFVSQAGMPTVVLAEAAAESAGASWIGDARILRDGADVTPLFQTVLCDLAVRAGRVAVGREVAPFVADAVKALLPGREFCEAAGLMDVLRMIKEPEEIARLRAVAKLTDDAMAAVLPRIVEGMTQRELEAEIELQGRRLGATGVSFPPAAKFTKSGSIPTDDPFTYPVDKGLVPGTSIAFDFGFVLDGYCSDFGRSVHFGDADASTRGAYDALQKAVVEAVGQMRTGGTRLCDLFPAIEKVLDGLGYGAYLRARLPNGVLGHQIGLEVHEDPWINPDSQGALEAGMVMALEPKLWRAGEYYLRVEDIILVGPDRTEFLTNYSRTVFQL